MTRVIRPGWVRLGHSIITVLAGAWLVLPFILPEVLVQSRDESGLGSVSGSRTPGLPAELEMKSELAQPEPTEDLPAHIAGREAATTPCQNSEGDNAPRTSTSRRNKHRLVVRGRFWEHRFVTNEVTLRFPELSMVRTES